MRDFLRGGLLLLLSIAWMMSCAAGELPVSPTTTSTGTGGGGMGGPDAGPCGVDCSAFVTADCTVAVCNTGQYQGPLNTCIVVPSPKGTPCDDGQFCTTADTCDNGTCVGGPPNTCGIADAACVAILCFEDTKSCSTTPVDDGTSCTPTDLCQVNGVCSIGECIGEPKDCKFSPMNECNTVACNPATGHCDPTPDPTKDDQSCVLTGDVCTVNRTCKNGACQGGTAKDCSAFTVGCTIGVCDTNSGICGPTPAPVGTACSEGIPECHVGMCDAKGGCAPSSGPDGVSCNDHNACTKSDKCTAGSCAGGPVSGCTLYLNEGFEVCPDGWTLGGDWQCGTPAMTSPVVAHTGKSVIATQLSGLYHVNQSFSTTVANSPPINLTNATAPQLSFWVWYQTEGGTFDGWNLKASTNGGQTFTEVPSVNPAYPLQILGQPAWGGDYSLQGWQNYTADLSYLAGQTVTLQFAFRSDAATVFTGVYLDDIVVAEPQELPLFITTTSPLPDVYAGADYFAQLTRTGGDGNAVWSITGGTNNGWLQINAATGVLSGTPTTPGPVTFTVHLEEPMLQSNFIDKTFTLNVKPDLYYTSFEGTCPNGWTLTGDWQCGVPTNVGPATAYVGMQCLGTVINGNYHDNDTYLGTTATSPPIDLTGASNPQLSFRMWVDTEGATYDGFNVAASSDGGMNYILIGSQMMPYPLMVGGKPAFGGHQAALGWQYVPIDLTQFANQTILLRFQFRSDSSGNFPGVYIDDILVN